MSNPPTVHLKKPLERSLRAGHPWIYADALSAPKGLSTGAVVDVVDRAGHFVARGLYDARNPIGVRVATLDAKESIDAAFIASRLERALKSRRGVIDSETTTAFRWCNGEGDFLPGVVVDVYAACAVVRLDGDAVHVWRDWIVDAIKKLGRGLGIAHIIERSRNAKSEVLFGGAPSNPIEILEHGVRFAVDVLHGQKTGFFLDQRENRRLLRDYSDGLVVANLFAYTGGFSVQAALGGAKKVVTVDSAPGAIQSARDNFALNGLDVDAHEFAVSDVFDWLSAQHRKREPYDLIVTDPPSFAPSQKALGRALAAYRDLNAEAIRLLPAGGLLAAASCSSHVTMELFLETLTDAAVKARRPINVLEIRAQPADHPTLPAFTEGRYLKFVLCRC